jgi:hypothetical protein
MMRNIGLVWNSAQHSILTWYGTRRSTQYWPGIELGAALNIGLVLNSAQHSVLAWYGTRRSTQLREGYFLFDAVLILSSSHSASLPTTTANIDIFFFIIQN